ncbi:PEP-CTERM protein-sorting domain-containing protein [Arsukibacterium tuosuense]|uniref:PEP-CTERM protein-sorting domain-containing protein n=1 Tax=Arsukibacterium tuosuense TaxID=1323745 RepID=A0A285IC46_9GAMM|nr:PEP-CTERM sorting domain-containing protein [Arsukibacterium tuosuense]SNY45503.1 PEP-CTERM protein-sorting domain-containing protein [Arsukibacterium tuosuense]
MKSIVLALCLLFSGLSHATLIQLATERSDYQIGETIVVSLSVSDVTETLGGFWAEILYPTSALSLLDWQFGEGFDDGFGSSPFADHDASSGTLYLEEYADLWADESILEGLQGSSFVLATFSFLATEAGNILLSFNPAEFGAINFDNDFIDVSTADLNFTVNAVQVPVPTTAILMIAGMALLLRRKQLNN